MDEGSICLVPLPHQRGWHSFDGLWSHRENTGKVVNSRILQLVPAKSTGIYGHIIVVVVTGELVSGLIGALGSKHLLDRIVKYKG